MNDEVKTKETKEVRPFLVITSNGYWGKGMTATEAAKEAHVGSSWVNASLYKANRAIKGEISCSGMGGTEWSYEPWVYDDDSVSDELRKKIKALARVSVRKAHGRARIRKGKLIIETEFD